MFGQNQYNQSNGTPQLPQSTAQRQHDQYQGIAFIVACLVTMILGPMAANWTEPHAFRLFVDLYSESTAEFLIEVWKIGMYALVWFIAQAYVYIAVLFIATYAGTRFLPAML